MVEIHEIECPTCGTIIEYTYERSVYENHVECLTCESFVKVDDDEDKGE
jgi:endogenous inhibitor of DNA gyrase (YacG/DUF329 family)